MLPDQMLAKIVRINNDLLTGRHVPSASDTLAKHYAEDLGGDWALPETLSVYRMARRLQTPYWDVRVAARCLACVLQPATYLEIGVRRGWSLAQVLSERADVDAYVCDLWIEDYGGFEQGSPRYLRRKMAEVCGDYKPPTLHFLSGNSHDVLPAWFAGELKSVPAAPVEFDLITIDGDHTRIGAWWDLIDLMPRVSVGGALIFDDIDELGDGEAAPSASSRYKRPALPIGAHTLMDLWLHVQAQHPNYVYWTCETLKFRAGVALRVE